MIKYTERSMAVTEDGYYLISCTGGDGTPRLCVAERLATEWYETGVDYDRWQYDRFEWILQVVCKLDLDKISEVARQVDTSAPQTKVTGLERMTDIAEARLMAIHKALEPEAFGITGIESSEDHVEYMTGVLRYALTTEGQPCATISPARQTTEEGWYIILPLCHRVLTSVQNNDLCTGATQEAFMTRINVVPVSSLCRTHLIAEHYEIADVFKLARRHVKAGRSLTDIKDRIPDTYRLGTGHVSFFLDKLQYCHFRFVELKNEMTRRGYRVGSWATLREIYPEMGEEWYGDYSPTPEAIAENQERINERIEAMKEKGMKP